LNAFHCACARYFIRGPAHFLDGLSASTPFIGPGKNNFSHKFEDGYNRNCAAANQSVPLRFNCCPEAMQALYDSASPVCPGSLHDGKPSAREIPLNPS
jgi:hypothetical protein